MRLLDIQEPHYLLVGSYFLRIALRCFLFPLVASKIPAKIAGDIILSTLFAPRFRLGWILIFIAALNGLFWTVFRWHYEDTLTDAQITVDYDDTRTMADAFGVDHETFLRELKKRGVTSLGIYELSLGNLRDNGTVTLVQREEAERLYPNVAWSTYPRRYRYVITVPPDNQALTWQVLNRLREQAPPGETPQVAILRAAPAGQPRNASQFGILLPASKQLLNDAQMGFDPQQIALCKKLGLSVTARLSNALNMNLNRVNQALDDAQKAGAKVVIFAEDEVLGYNSMIREVAKEMQNRGLLFGNIEFSKQRGWEGFTARSNGQLVRVHSVGPDEAAKWQPEALTERFTRAVRERNIRVAYIRLIRHFKGEYKSSPGEEPTLEKSALQQNYDFIEGVAKELHKQPLPFAWLRPGVHTSTAKAFGNYPLDQLGGGALARVIRYLGLFLSSLGMVGAGLLLANLFLEWDAEKEIRRLMLGVALVTFLLLLDYVLEVLQTHGGGGIAGRVLSLWPGYFGQKLIATAVGCVFPALAILWGGLPQVWDSFLNPFPTRAEQETPISKIWLRGAKILLVTSLLMMTGPLLIISLLNQWRFFSGTDKFFFPKLTQLVPLLIIGLAFAGDVFPHRVISEGAAAARARARQWFRNLLEQPFTARVALIGGVLAIAGFIWIARTGNDSGMEISGLELKMRSILEQVFITRPRTKEVFIGHPAMIFAVYFALRRQWTAAFAATILATIGQADMLNTFCHLHTPIFYSLLRSIHAVWLGILIGGAALWAYHKIFAPRAFASYSPSNRTLGEYSTQHTAANGRTDSKAPDKPQSSTRR